VLPGPRPGSLKLTTSLRSRTEANLAQRWPVDEERRKHPRSAQTDAGKGVYVYHFRMRGVRGPDIHPKHLPVRILCRASHNQMGK
jgi:hypothetical protein